MGIDWNNFTPWSALAGGVTLGVAAAMFILVSGRVLGISSILGDALRAPTSDLGWPVAFFAGLLTAPLLYSVFAPLPAMHIDTGWGGLVLAGLLVGIGTRFGAGCTSGHGVCGLSRLSLRSLVATLTFMATGFATVFVVRHVLA